jgi:hypothetical protein
MAPKRDAATRAKKAVTPTRTISEQGDDEEDGSGSEEGIQPSRFTTGSLNPTFDRTIAPPSASKGKEAAAAAETSGSVPSDYVPHFILEQQEQAEQLRQLFSLVSSLGSEIRTIVRSEGRVPDVGSSREPVEAAIQSGPSTVKGKVTFCDSPLEQEVEDEEESDDDADVVEVSRDKFVSHSYYRDRIGEGFAKRAPSRLSSSKPSYFPIDDPVTRSLNASKFSAKATEYSLTVANAFYASVTKAALDDAIVGFTDGSDPKEVYLLLKQVQANMGAIEDMHRDRMLFLDLTSDPSSSATERDYANNILKQDFIP